MKKVNPTNKVNHTNKVNPVNTKAKSPVVIPDEVLEQLKKSLTEFRKNVLLAKNHLSSEQVALLIYLKKKKSLMSFYQTSF